MKKKLFVLLAVIMVLSIVSMPAFATPPDNTVEGRWCYGYIEEGEHKIAGSNEFFDLDSTDGWTGTFNGLGSSDGRVRVHPSGYTLLKSDVTLHAVTVDDKTGTLEMRINGWLPAGGAYSDYEGLWVITSGTGELAGLHGQGTWGGVEFGNPVCTDIDDGFIASVPYSGSIHLDP
jgi:hypothetical protein